MAGVDLTERRGVTVCTWNVLHYVHAMNYREPPVGAIPEPDRIAGVCDMVDELLDLADVVCLQEASGEVLRSLIARGTATDDRAVESYQLRRKPALRVSAPDRPGTHTEHLIVVVRAGLGVAFRNSGTFSTDPGKGYLKVGLVDGPVVVCTHLPWNRAGGGSADAVRKEIREMRLAHGTFTIVCGDMNCEHLYVPGMVQARFDRTPPVAFSRPGDSSNIDLLLTNRRAGDAIVRGDGARFSDHNPVTATFWPGAYWPPATSTDRTGAEIEGGSAAAAAAARRGRAAPNAPVFLAAAMAVATAAVAALGSARSP